MYKTIILDCQTQTGEANCENCILYKQCKSKKATAENSAGAVKLVSCEL